jgi:phosphate transport system permease protein
VTSERHRRLDHHDRAGVGIGAPGLFAGTYLAEYGKHDRLTSVIRFINDILLSAPSIIIGLFVYGAIVVPMGGFSALLVRWPGRDRIPVVVRTTEDMLGLVPNPLREAACARPAAFARDQAIAYRAARPVSSPVSCWRQRVSPVKPRRCCLPREQPVLQPRSHQDDGEPAGDHQQLRPEPYEYWKQLAWTGALLITFTVLALNIGARVLGAERKTK